MTAAIDRRTRTWLKLCFKSVVSLLYRYDRDFPKVSVTAILIILSKLFASSGWASERAPGIFPRGTCSRACSRSLSVNKTRSRPAEGLLILAIYGHYFTLSIGKRGGVGTLPHRLLNCSPRKLILRHAFPDPFGKLNFSILRTRPYYIRDDIVCIYIFIISGRLRVFTFRWIESYDRFVHVEMHLDNITKRSAMITETNREQ